MWECERLGLLGVCECGSVRGWGCWGCECGSVRGWGCWGCGSVRGWGCWGCEGLVWSVQCGSGEAGTAGGVKGWYVSVECGSARGWGCWGCEGLACESV